MPEHLRRMRAAIAAKYAVIGKRGVYESSKMLSRAWQNPESANSPSIYRSLTFGVDVTFTANTECPKL